MISTNTPDIHTLERDFLVYLKAKGRSINTLKNYKTDLDSFNKYLNKINLKMTLCSITDYTILEYETFLTKNSMSDNSKRRRIQALRIFFDFLVNNNHYSTNPIKNLIPSPKVLDIPRPTPFRDIKLLWPYLLEEEKSNDHISKLIALRNQIIILLIFGSGLKVSTLAKLKTTSILSNTPPRVMIIPEKKRDPYSIPLPDIFNTIYQKYTNLLKTLKLRNKLEFDNILFNANQYKISSGGLSPRGLEVIFEELRKKLKINLTPKSLRQACIFKWIHQNISDATIKEWLGVSPTYNLQIFKIHSPNHPYNEDFLKEVYKHHQS